jgi:hypothetical protein
MQLELDELKKGRICGNGKERHGEKVARKNNLIVFGLEERNGERYEDMQKIVEQLVMEKMGVHGIQGHTDYVTRPGRSRGNRPIFVKFTTFSKKLEVLKNTRKLTGSKIRVEQDYSREVREIRRELRPYLKDARSRGHKAVTKKDKLILNGRTYSLEKLKEKTKLATRSDGMDNPDSGLRQKEKMIQQDRVGRNEVYRETSLSFASSKQGKQGSHCTTAETSRFMRDSIDSSVREGEEERRREARRKVGTYDMEICGGKGRKMIVEHN